MGAMGLMWVFHEEQRATTYLLLVKFSEAWRIFKLIQSCGHHLASCHSHLAFGICKFCPGAGQSSAVVSVPSVTSAILDS